MEANERKTKLSTIIITIVLILLLIGTSIAIYFLYDKYTNETSKYKKQKAKYNELVKEEEKVISHQQQLKDEISYIENIDANMANMKTEVFSLASQVEQKIKNNESDKKIAYLTFDDGPYYLTYQFLDVLDNYNVKATFFTIGRGKTSCYDNSSQDCTKLYPEIVSRGHTIANHTYSHLIRGGLYSSADSFMYQLQLQEDLIKNYTGVITNIVRFPGGSGTAGNLKNSIIQKLREKNYGWVDWTALNGDGGALGSVDQAWSTFTRSINDNIEVVLFHDYNYITLATLPRVIEYLQQNNYIILPLFYESVMINK